MFHTCLTSWIGLSCRRAEPRYRLRLPPRSTSSSAARSLAASQFSFTSAGIEIIVLFNHACAGREGLPGWPQNHGVSAAQYRAGMAPADAPEAPSGAQSARVVAPSRADDQRPFDRVRCRLAGADFLEVFVSERFFGAAIASGGVSSGNATAWEMISPATVSRRVPHRKRRNAAAFCASNPRRAAVKVRASQGSIGCSPMTRCDASQSQPLLGVRVPTSAANLRIQNGAARMLPNTSPESIVPRAPTKDDWPSEQF